MSLWYGIWHGGSGYALSELENDLERFGSIESAKEALSDRYHSGYSWFQTFDYVNRNPESVLTPAVGEDSCIHLFASLDCLDYPDRCVRFGPRGGVRVENC
ncbi:hypothetical protein [Nocardiopsis dassonvillei]|uniref:hypothetical protein n=1 Tax=Nocardiopsis dassonvillei TaxID=2014 RepID=UPI00034D7A45